MKKMGTHEQPAPYSLLRLGELELSVYLGWHEHERQSPQSVFVDIDILFLKTPQACESDELKHTICYAQLIHSIRAHLADKKFNLIEHLAHTLFIFIRLHLKEIPLKLRLSLIKFPLLPGLTGGVRFDYGDPDWPC